MIPYRDFRRPAPVSYVIGAVALVTTLVMIGALLVEAIVVDEILKLFRR